jgi:hypothetical protein
MECLPMTVTVQNMIQSFERLSDAEKREVATEILRRSLQFDFPPLKDDEFVLSAEELFLELDKRESEDG